MDDERECDEQRVYQIRVQGKLDEHWSDWFNGMAITSESGITTLTGAVMDQARLRGILSKIWDLNLTVISVERQQNSSGAVRKISWKQILRFAIFVLVTPMVLFASAGRLDWWMAWAYTGLVIAATRVSRVVVARKNPDLLAERAQASEGEGIKPWDKVIVPLIAIYGPIVTCIVAGLDIGFGWSPQVPLALKLAALIIVELGSVVSTWAMVANKFFSAYVCIQEDRGHTVATGGPYQYVRHPGYAGGLLAWLVTPAMFGSLWAFMPAGIVVFATIIRTALEDKTLLEELNGYRDYAQQVRYRLVPGVW